MDQKLLLLIPWEPNLVPFHEKYFRKIAISLKLFGIKKKIVLTREKNLEDDFEKKSIPKAPYIYILYGWLKQIMILWVFGL